jgi:hypothetical protein
MYKVFSWGKLSVRCYFEDLVLNGRVLLKRVLKREWGVDWIAVTQ